MYNNENIQLYNGDFNDYYDTVPDSSIIMSL